MGGRPAPGPHRRDEPPVDEPTERFPLRLTTGRRLESYNTGVQSGATTRLFTSVSRSTASPEDADRYGLGSRRLRSSDVAPRIDLATSAHG